MTDGIELQGFVFDSSDLSMLQGEFGGAGAAPLTSSMAGEWEDKESEAAIAQQPADGEIEFEQLPDDEFERYLRGDGEE